MLRNNVLCTLFFNRESYYPNDSCSNATIEQFGRVGEGEDGERIIF